MYTERSFEWKERKNTHIGRASMTWWWTLVTCSLTRISHRLNWHPIRMSQPRWIELFENPSGRQTSNLIREQIHCQRSFRSLISIGFLLLSPFFCLWSWYLSAAVTAVCSSSTSKHAGNRTLHDTRIDIAWIDIRGGRSSASLVIEQKIEVHMHAIPLKQQ